MFDEIKNKFFSNPDEFKQAMQLLQDYEVCQSQPWEIAQIFVEDLDPHEENLIDCTMAYKNAIEKSKNQPLNLSAAINHDSLIEKPISELIELFLQERGEDWSEKHKQSNIKSAKPKLELLIEVHGDILGSELTTSHIVEFKQAVLALPKNKTKGKYAKLTIHEILKSKIPKQELLASETKKSYMQRVSGFLEWLSDNNYAKENLNRPLRKMRFSKKPVELQRPQFIEEDLTKIFNSRQYTQGTHKKPAHYWAPLIGIYTGARQGEICQLYKNDIKQDEQTGIWYFDFNENAHDKSLKKAEHQRNVPVHKQLIKLKFLEFVTSVKSERLFPDLEEGKRDSYGQQLSRWFNDTYLNERNCNVKTRDSQLCFHSFRHTVITQLHNVHQVQHKTIGYLMGQQSGDRSVTTMRYTKSMGLKEHQKIINKLAYPSVDFSQIRRWN